jgi:outer membrane murein-binding lipoprotein Lpp
MRNAAMVTSSDAETNLSEPKPLASASNTDAPALAPAPQLIRPPMADDPPLPPLPPLPPQEPRIAGAASAGANPVAAAPRQSKTFLLAAASIVLAAGIGATVGAVAWSGIDHPVAEPAAVASTAVAPVLAAEDIRALHGTIAQLRGDLSALRTSVEAGAKSASAQFAKINERLDRVQAEQATKINKVIDNTERLEKRADVATRDVTTRDATARDVTGSGPQPAVASLPAPQPIVTGWVLRDVNRGVAILQGRAGLIEVEAGDLVPGLGRIESIRKQGNRWVVVTSRGLVTALR